MKILHNYILKGLVKDSVALQAVLKEFPFTFKSLAKGALMGASIIRSGEKSFYPVAISLESSAKCNLKCTRCPRTDMLTRNIGNMDYNLYKETIDSINPVFVTLAQLGEPLLHPRIVDMVDYVSKRGIMSRINTNATLLNDDINFAFIKAKLSHMLISFDSCNKTIFEKIRPGAIFEKVVANIKNMIVLKEKLNSYYPLITFNVTLSKDNVGEISDIVNFCLSEFGIPPTFTKMYTYGEAGREKDSMDLVNLESLKRGYEHAKEMNLNTVCDNLRTIYYDVKNPLNGYRPCFFTYYSVSVTWDGKVYPCCIYFDEQVVFGDLSKQSFREIWNGKEYREFRKKLRDNRDDIPLCRTCSLIDVGINNIISRFKTMELLINAFSKRRFSYIKRDTIGE